MSNTPVETNAIEKKHAATSTAYMGNQASRYDALRFTTPGGQRVHEIELKKVLRACERIERPGRLLEVGCGTGRLLGEVSAAGYRVDGVDASPDMINQVKNKFGKEYPDMSLYVEEAARLPFSDGTFDFTYSVRLLNQTESPSYALRVIRDMVRVTKLGGYVLVEFANVWRPRIGRNRGRATRLIPREAISTGIEAGASLIRCEGAFSIGMTSYQLAPSPFLPIVTAIDLPLAWAFPRLCARVYVLFRKDHEQ